MFQNFAKLLTWPWPREEADFRDAPGFQFWNGVTGRVRKFYFTPNGVLTNNINNVNKT